MKIMAKPHGLGKAKFINLDTGEELDMLTGINVEETSLMDEDTGRDMRETIKETRIRFVPTDDGALWAFFHMPPDMPKRWRRVFRFLARFSRFRQLWVGRLGEREVR